MASFEIRLQNFNKLISILEKKRQETSPDNPALKRALTRVGLLISNQAKLNIRKKGLIDTGRLVNSLRYEFYKPDGDGVGLRIGSFGVPYAAVWEFGGTFRIRAHNRTITQAFGKVLKTPVVANVRSHMRTVQESRTGYLRPAFEQHKSKIIDIITSELGE